MMEKCKDCEQSVNAVNGLYCRLLKHYISRAATQPPCEVEKGKTNEYYK